MFENFLFYFYFASNVLGEKSVFYATEKKMMKKKEGTNLVMKIILVVY